MSDIVTTLRSGELCGEDRCRVMNAEGGCTCAVAAAEIERLREALDGAYNERNHLVAVLAQRWPSGLKKTAIEGWDECWHNCVYIDLPWGQASWHFHDRDAHLFAGLPPYEGEWDGHTTEEKYAAIRAALEAKDE